MKKYKVGDTIYVKGKIIHADESYGKFPYCVSFSDSDFTGIIDMCQAWLDEDSFVESPVKPMMPKDVADEMSFAKSIKGVTFDDYIVRELIRSDYKDSATNKMIKSLDVPNAIELLLNAWNNGYTVKKEPANLVYVPGTNKKFVYNKRGDTATRMAKLETPVVPSPVTSYETAYDQYKPLYEFTDVEITKFGLQDCEWKEVTDDDTK